MQIVITAITIVLIVCFSVCVASVVCELINERKENGK